MGKKEIIKGVSQLAKIWF
ncbi:Protein of unknown function [Bacillus cereus]|nr:Protein of unknown function [Bacillus cereus]